MRNLITDVKTPEELVESLNRHCKHDFRYSTDLHNVDFNLLIHKYFSDNQLPSYTFVSRDSFMNEYKGSCYDLSLFACHVLKYLGYESDLLHFSWTPDNSTAKGFVACAHLSCRFWIDSNNWYVISGFLYGSEVEIFGPFSCLEDFINVFNEVIRDSLPNSQINIVDSLMIENEYCPSVIIKLFPIMSKAKKLEYWSA